MINPTIAAAIAIKEIVNPRDIFLFVAYSPFGSGLDEVEGLGVEPLAVHSYLKVKMSAGGVAGRADIAYHVSGGNMVALFHYYLL